MEGVKEVTHIVPVGFTPQKLIDSVRQHIVHKVIIVTLLDDDKRKKVIKAVDRVSEAFNAIDVQKKVVEREDVFKAALDILDIIKDEVSRGKTVKINIAGGMRNVGISSYIASLVSKVEIYSDIPESITGQYKLKGILEIPPFPIKEIPSEQFEIIRNLEGGVDSLEDLISKLKPGLKRGGTKFNNERSRISHHLKKLKDDRFIETQKKKKNLSVRRSILGEIYVRGKEISSLMEV